MKDFSAFIYKGILTLALCVWLFLLCGCQQPGETTQEGRIRHKRVLRINSQEMMSDIDRALLLDKPSKLTDKKIP